jgi:TPR repeat protein
MDFQKIRCKACGYRAVVTLSLVFCVNIVFAEQKIENASPSQIFAHFQELYEQQDKVCPPNRKEIKKLAVSYLNLKKLESEGKKVEYKLAIANLYGLGTTDNLSAAFYFFQRAANHGNVKAMRQLGLLLLQGGVGSIKTSREIKAAWKQAVYWLKAAANKGDVQSILLMSYLYHEGGSASSLVKNDEKSFQYALLAANSGNARAYLNLGDFYYSGYYVKQSYKIAETYYLKALAQAGLPVRARKYYLKRIVRMNQCGVIELDSVTVIALKKELMILVNKHFC